MENRKTFYCTDKTLKDERITLVENNKVVSDESELVEIFSKYFGNIVQNLVINNLDTSKVTQQCDIPTKIIKDNKDLFSYFISASFNNAVNKGVFPNELKQADIKPIYKKESRNEKENYRPISILPNLSKIFERCMYDQLKDHFEKLLSKYHCGFRKREKDLTHSIAY